MSQPEKSCKPGSAADMSSPKLTAISVRLMQSVVLVNVLDGQFEYTHFHQL